jgi:hypothetical protein
VLARAVPVPAVLSSRHSHGWVIFPAARASLTFGSASAPLGTMIVEPLTTLAVAGRPLNAASAPV